MLENGECWIRARGDAETYLKSVAWVGLVESCSKALVEVWFDAFDGADDGKVG